MASCQQIDNVVHFFTSQQLSILDFFRFLLTDGSIASHPMVLDFLGSRSEVISLLVSMEPQEVGFQCAHNLMRQRYKDEIRELLKVEHSWQFNALHASADQIDQFRIKDMASSMEWQSPYLWTLLGFAKDMAWYQRPVQSCSEYLRVKEPVVLADFGSFSQLSYWGLSTAMTHPKLLQDQLSKSKAGDDATRLRW